MGIVTRRLVAPLACMLAACTPAAPVATPPTAPAASAPAASAAVAAPAPPITLTIVGTNDLHGHIEALPAFGGFLRVLRATRPADAVVLLDGGDMFQGTLESNLGEGAAVVRAYNALGYSGAALGNHEFDFGPAGPNATVRAAGDDPRGALKARSSEARFPFLSANVVDEATGTTPAFPNLHGHVTQVHAGVTVGLVGVTTEDTPQTTIAANFKGLRMTPLAEAIAREAALARSEGATVIVVVAHAGGSCKAGSAPGDPETCDATQEIARALAALPKGEVDAVVAGHTHKAMATLVSGVPTIESFSSGRAFGRVDLTVDGTTKRVTANHIFAPQSLTLPATYDGHEVVVDDEVAHAVALDIEIARARKEAPIGIVLDGPVTRSHDVESAEGNLFADLLRGALETGTADVAVTNGGGLRADLPAGDLRYGALFEAMPFDNRLAVVKLHGRDLRALIAENLKTTTGILSISGVRVVAECRKGALEIVLTRANGRVVKDDDALTLTTTDFLATGGDGARFPTGSVTIADTVVRDAFELGLKKRGGHLRATPTLFDPKHPRIAFPTPRPVRCGE